MARHSFIQMSKLSNVKGRISYISDPKRQEYLYATFSTREDMTFWNDLAKECQEEFKRFGTEGKCIEARELIIALPEEYTKFDPNQVLREFTEQFKKRYDVECVSALHHNKTKKNYHIHLIFSERRLLPEPEVKIATRSVFYDELGKRVRTKKEIPGEDGQIREGCIVIKKGEAYEKHLFTAKDEVFKNELFLDEAKQFYTALINRHIHDPERRLKVFDPNSVYLPTKKIGKNNPKEAEIEADNAARQDWNRTADMALVSGIEESKIIEIRNEHVYDEATRSVQKHGWLPGLFRGIIQKAKEILQVLIRETEIPLNADRVGIRFCVELTLASVPKRRFRQGVQVSQLRAQVFLDFERFLDSRNDCVAIEVRVGNRSKQVDGHEMVDVLSDLFSFLPEFSGHAGKPLRHIDQQIEHGRQFGSLSAYADLCAAGAPRRLLTLIAEHFTFFHWFLLLSFLPFT